MAQLNTVFEKSYTETHFFPDLILDFLQRKEHLQSLYTYKKFDLKTLVEERSKFALHRETLQHILKRQLKNYANYPLLEKQIKQLASPTTFTICTAHQPHLAFGPLYLFYKLLHIVLWAKSINKQQNDVYIVPVFFMGSEDADKGELLSLSIRGKSYRYQTRQMGAVGRMTASRWKAFIDTLCMPLASYPYIEELKSMFASYEDISFAEIARQIALTLFAEEGLLVIDIDDEELKKTCMPLFEQEILHRFSQPLLEQTSRKIQSHYGTAQLEGSTVNLFHITNELRTKVLSIGDSYQLPIHQELLTKEDYLHYAQNHAETISPNAVLRPLVQEIILPNIAYVGGGGELAYWLQLKAIFDEAEVHFPYLQLRHSFTVINESDFSLLRKLGVDIEQLVQHSSLHCGNFFPQDNEVLKAHNTMGKKFQHQFTAYKSYLQQQGIKDVRSVEALHHRFHQTMQRMTKKMMQHHKSQHTFSALQRVHERLFPFSKLQERSLSFVELYAHYGNGIVDAFFQLDIEQTSRKFTVLEAK